MLAQSLIDTKRSQGHDIIMFPFKHCIVPGCPAFTYKETDYCYHHSPDKAEILSEVTELLEKGGSIRDISLVNAEIRGIRTGKALDIIASNFSFTVFEDCVFENARIIASFFDYCIFSRCRFISCDIRYSVFAGSMFASSSITDSTVIHNNFMGIEAADSDFSSNDFYFSSFSLSKMQDTSLEDCNLKRTNFRPCITKNVSFRYSNPEEAFFRKDEGYTI